MSITPLAASAKTFNFTFAESALVHESEGGATTNLAQHLLVILIDDAPILAPFGDIALISNSPGPEVGPTSAIVAGMPTVSSLAAKGLRFNASRAQPLCSPSRGSIQTGRLNVRTGIGNVIGQQNDGDLAEFLDPGYGFPCLYPELEQLGVKLAWVGKTHLSAAKEDTFTGARYAGRPGSGWSILSQIVTPSTYLFAHLRNLNQVPVPGGGAGTLGGYYSYFYSRLPDDDAKVANTGGEEIYATSVQADEVAAFFSGLNPDTDRGFCYWAASACHSPFGVSGNPHRDFPPDRLVATQEYKDKRDADQVTTWETYMAMMESLDSEIGRALNSIPLSIRQKLTVVIVNDNGVEPAMLAGIDQWGKDYGTKWSTLRANPQGRLKGSVYRWGTFAGMIWSGPEPQRFLMARAGQSTWTCAQDVDLFPTIIEYFGGTPPFNEGFSLLPVVWSTADALTHTRDWTFASKFHPNGNHAAITTGETTEEQPSPDEMLHYGVQHWLRSPTYSPAGLFALVRKKIAGAFVDRVYHHVDETGNVVDLFEETDLKDTLPLHYAALVAKLTEILTGQGGGTKVWPILLEDDTTDAYAPLDAGEQVEIEDENGGAATFVTDIDSVPGEDENGAVIDFPLLTLGGGDIWYQLLDTETAAPITPNWEYDAAEFAAVEDETGADIQFESTHESTPNRQEIELEDGSVGYFELTQD